MMSTISKEEQAFAILHAKEWDLAKRYFDGDVSRLEAELNVTREELKEHISRHGYPEGWWRFAPATYDGLYLLPREGAWVVFLQERGVVYFEKALSTKETAIDFVLDEFYLKKPRQA